MAGPGKRFTPGKITNPHGRPKRGESLTDVLRLKLAETIVVEDVDGTPITRTRRQVLADKLIALAMGGSLPAMQLIWERIDGKLPQPLAPPPPPPFSVLEIGSLDDYQPPDRA